ncbi:MAG: hypothetical protein QM523_06905 [Candidatus Pacebacteria bacterium]|nr:hypothetical protein [Candidatus Paceibacterota bacterium]
METPQKSISIILCEGKVDAILLGYLMQKASDYKPSYESNSPPFALTTGARNQVEEWYSKKTKTLDGVMHPASDLVIVSVGSSDFSNLTSKVLRVIENQQELSIEKLLFVADRDAKTEDDHIIEFMNCLKIYDDKMSMNPIKIGVWFTKEVTQKSYSSAEVTTVPSVEVNIFLLPVKGIGALETHLLDALNEKELVNLSRIFSQDGDIESFYPPKPREADARERMKEKAALGCTLAVLEPDQVVNKLGKRILAIEWEKLPELQPLLEVLHKL